MTTWITGMITKIVNNRITIEVSGAIGRFGTLPVKKDDEWIIDVAMTYMMERTYTGLQIEAGKIIDIRDQHKHNVEEFAKRVES